MPTLIRFFGPVDGSIKGLLNFEELYRSFLACLGSGSAIGALVFLSRTALGVHAEILPETATASLDSMLLSLVFDLLRRLTQGVDLAPKVVPVPNPSGPLPGPTPVLPTT